MCLKIKHKHKQHKIYVFCAMLTKWLTFERMEKMKTIKVTKAQIVLRYENYLRKTGAKKLIRQSLPISGYWVNDGFISDNEIIRQFITNANKQTKKTGIALELIDPIKTT
jgi:hypothetical protein